MLGQSILSTISSRNNNNNNNNNNSNATTTTTAVEGSTSTSTTTTTTTTIQSMPLLSSWLGHIPQSIVSAMDMIRSRRPNNDNENENGNDGTWFIYTYMLYYMQSIFLVISLISYDVSPLFVFYLHYNNIASSSFSNSHSQASKETIRIT